MGGFKVGDEVFGHLQYNGKTSQGSLSEYVTVKADSCTLKPVQVSADIAAASTTETLTALQGLCNQGGLRKKKQQQQQKEIIVKANSSFCFGKRRWWWCWFGSGPDSQATRSYRHRNLQHKRC